MTPDSLTSSSSVRGTLGTTLAGERIQRCQTTVFGKCGGGVKNVTPRDTEKSAFPWRSIIDLRCANCVEVSVAEQAGQRARPPRIVQVPVVIRALQVGQHASREVEKVRWWRIIEASIRKSPENGPGSRFT